MTTCEICEHYGKVLAELCDLRRELQVALEAKEKAERIATQATSELGHCFLKYQQTCAAYNELKKRVVE